MHFSKNREGTLRHKIYYSQVLEGTWHGSGPHSRVRGGEREPGALPLLGSEGGVPRIMGSRVIGKPGA